MYTQIFFFDLLCCVGSGSSVAANVIQWRNQEFFGAGRVVHQIQLRTEAEIMGYRDDSPLV
jgi:hypothetical protein